MFGAATRTVTECWYEWLITWANPGWLCEMPLPVGQWCTWSDRPSCEKWDQCSPTFLFRFFPQPPPKKKHVPIFPLPLPPQEKREKCMFLCTSAWPTANCVLSHVDIQLLDPAELEAAHVVLVLHWGNLTKTGWWFDRQFLLSRIII